MSTSTTELTYVSGEQHNVSEETVRALIERGATEKQAVAISLHDNGYSNQQVGDAWADLFGTAIKSGGAGNLVVNGLRAVGRGGEVQSTGGKPSGGKPKSLKALIAATREAILADANRLIERVRETQRAVNELNTETVVSERIGAIDQAIAELNAEKKALQKDPKPYVDKVAQERTAAMDAARNSYQAQLEPSDGDQVVTLADRVSEFEEMTGVSVDLPTI